MLGDFWSELFGSVGSLLSGLRVTRQQGDLVFADPDEASRAAGLAAGAGLDLPDAPAQPMWVQARTQLATLQKADPNFLEADFLSAAAKTYGGLLAAEGAMNAETVAALVTPALLATVTQRFAGWRAQGMTRVVSGVQLDPPVIFQVSIGGQTQSIEVRFTGTATRFTKDDMTSVVAEGSAQAQSFTEFATFVRPAGSTTPATAASGAAIHCPSCGAPADPGALVCAYCGASLSGTGGTWLLDHTSVSAYT